MNRAAERHLVKAGGYLEKGEGFYHKAAEEIVAAQEADPMLSQREIGELFNRQGAWVSRLVKWHTSASGTETPFAESSDKAVARHTKQLLREAPLEQVEKIVGSLPRERQQAIAAAAGHSYLTARQEQDEAERRRTPAERREREEARESLTRPTRQAVGGFAALGIVGHLEQATEELRELQADASLTPQAAKKIERALDEFVREFDFAKALLGGGDDR